MTLKAIQIKYELEDHEDGEWHINPSEMYNDTAHTHRFDVNSRKVVDGLPLALDVVLIADDDDGL